LKQQASPLLIEKRKLLKKNPIGNTPESWSPPEGRKRGRRKLTWAEGIRGLMGEKGLMEEYWSDRGQVEEEDNIIVKWAQEDVETLYNLLNK